MRIQRKDHVILERSLNTRLSIPRMYIQYSVLSKHTVREGGARGYATQLEIKDKDTQWRVSFAHRRECVGRGAEEGCGGDGG